METYNQYQDLKEKVLIWAKDKGILSKEFANKQFMKFIEESGELSRNILKGQDCTDDFGDVLVTLIILSEQLGYDLVDCLEAAYNEIKDREGSTINGLFIKEESPVEEKKYRLNENVSAMVEVNQKISNIESSIKDLEEEGKDPETIKLMKNKLEQFKASLSSIKQEIINEFDESLNEIIKCSYEINTKGAYLYRFKGLNVILDLEKNFYSIHFLEETKEGERVFKHLISDPENILDILSKSQKNEN